MVEQQEIIKQELQISFITQNDHKRRMRIEDYTNSSFEIRDNETILQTVVNHQSLSELKKKIGS